MSVIDSFPVFVIMYSSYLTYTINLTYKTYLTYKIMFLSLVAKKSAVLQINCPLKHFKIQKNRS